ncbi:hypothetical protein CEXT_671861 [Caerostris extrusa]|uniref:Uncharacterized protein n=1 Tax=Caerostris extrusa TaxID=172846 RepID=A0AAV4S3B0_CAEEX|nr:hypothetical protein CEXT_671861 [Caerostris extrusa]
MPRRRRRWRVKPGAQHTSVFFCPHTNSPRRNVQEGARSIKSIGDHADGSNLLSRHSGLKMVSCGRDNGIRGDLADTQVRSG